jgi:hypothetical protein
VSIDVGIDLVQQGLARLRLLRRLGAPQNADELSPGPLQGVQVLLEAEGPVTDPEGRDSLPLREDGKVREGDRAREQVLIQVRRIE